MRKSYQATSWSSPQWICEEKCLLSWLRYFERVLFLWKVLGQCQQLCFPTASPPSTLSSLPSRSFPTESNGALPKLFPTASPPSSLSSLPSRSLPRSSARSFCTGKPLHREALTHRSFYTQKVFTQRSLYTETFTQKLWHTDAFRQWSLDTRTRLQTEAFMHRSFFAQSSFTQRSLDTEKPVHTKAFKERRLLYREVLTQRSFYTEKSLHKGDLHTDTFTNRRFYK